MKVTYCDLCGNCNTSKEWGFYINPVKLLLPSPDGVNHSEVEYDLCHWCRRGIRIAMDEEIIRLKKNNTKETA